MLRIITILLSIITFSITNAQTEGKTYYLSSEFNLGNYVGVDINLNYILNEKYSFKLGYNGNFREPRSQPENYNPGLFGAMFFGFGDPYDQLENYQIGFGKIYKLNESGTTRANIALGLGYTTIREPVNWMANNDIFFGGNYTWDYHKDNTISLIINPKIEFPFTRFFGLTLSPMIQVNKYRTYFGIGLGQMVGLLRNKVN